MSVASPALRHNVTRVRRIGRWGDVNVENTVSISPLAMIILGLVLAGIIFILLGYGANQASSYFNFQTGQPISNFGNSLLGWGYGIFDLLGVGFVVVVVAYIWSKSSEGGYDYY